jgi:hypothetical protein
MKKAVAGKLGIIVIGAILGAGPVANAIAQDQKDSGFLRDYSRLQETQDSAGKTVRAWTSPKLAPDNYNAIMLDPLIFYPEPRPSERVSAQALDQILNYTNDVLRQSMGARFKLVNTPGPGVARIRAAFSSVGSKEEGLKPYQYIPLAFLVTTASRAASGTPHQAFIIVEVEITDSVSGQLLGSRVRVLTGEGLAKAVGEKDPITLQLVKPVLDAGAKNAFPELSKYIKPK